VTQPVVDVNAIQTKNQAALKGMPEKFNGKWKMALLPVHGKNEFVLFIDPMHHDKKITNLLPPGTFEGLVNVGKGGLLGPGEVIVWGMPTNPKAREAFKRYIAAFSKKKVTFK
jgi:hypothetical protein